MSRRELRRAGVFTRVESGELKLKNAAEMLEISYRQSKRLWKRFQQEGPEGLKHRSAGRESNRRKPTKLRERVLRLVNKKYSGEEGTRFGPTLAAEHLASEDHVEIHPQTLRRWMLEEGLWSRARKRRVHRVQRERKEHFGELVQMDGSFHDWFEGRGPRGCLMNMVDDATNRGVAHMGKEETTWAAAGVLREWIDKYGIPLALYTDWKNVYIRKPTETELLHGTVPVTQFGGMCARLGIKIIAASSPQAKGRVERNHGTHQDRLVKKMRLKKIASYEPANEFLRREYMPEHNRHFERPPASPEDYHRLAPGKRELDEVFHLETERTVGNNWVVRHDSRYFQLKRQGQYYPPAKSKVHVREWEDGKLEIHYRGRKLQHQEIAAPVPAINIAPANVSKVDIHTPLGSTTTQIYAHLLPWFQMPDQNPMCDGVTGQPTHTCNMHVQVGYDSNDAHTVEAQISDMVSRGFNGLIIDWGGQVGIDDGTTQAVNENLSNRCNSGNCSFHFALMEDQRSFQTCLDQTQTACIIGIINNDLTHMNRQYFPSPAYLRLNGRPVLLFFVDEGSFLNANWTTIWQSVADHAATQAGNPILLFRGEGGFNSPQQSGGAFAWVNCNGTISQLGGCTNDPSGLTSLVNFYAFAATQTDKEVWGAGWKGFDRSQSPFLSNAAVLRQDCGQTWIATLRAMSGHFGGVGQSTLPAVQIATWNDYEEGTEIETGIDNCIGTIDVSRSSSTLFWSYSFTKPEGSPETVHHYEIYDESNVQIPSQIEPCTTTTAPNGNKTVGCSAAVSPDVGTVFVRIVGQPSIINHLSSSALPPLPDPIYACGMTLEQYQVTERACNRGGEFVWVSEPYCICGFTPIVIDTRGTGIALTSAAAGVDFTMVTGAPPIRVAWTSAGSGNAFLVLDRNGNGLIDNGSELFGNATPQPPSQASNGFLALAEYDKVENGGDENGIIDKHDQVYPLLRLWIDANHNGISAPDELFTLAELGLTSISLDYRPSERRDENGNVFRYRAKIKTNTEGVRWAYDVVLNADQVKVAKSFDLRKRFELQSLLAP